MVRKLTSGDEDEEAGTVRWRLDERMRWCIGGFEVGDEGKKIGQSFSSTCLSGDQRGGTIEQGRNGPLLDKGRSDEGEGSYSWGHGRMEVEGRESGRSGEVEAGEAEEGTKAGSH